MKTIGARRQRAWSVWVAVTVCALCTALCAYTPLTHMLGYESAAILALALGVVSPSVGLSVRARVPNGHVAARRALSITGGLWLATGVATWLISLALGSCNDAIGALFWLLVPLPSAWFGTSVGLALGRWPALAGRRQTRFFAAAAVVTVAVGATLYGLWANPPVRAFSHLLGYFAGSLFDEDVAVPKSLIAARAVTLLWTGALLLASQAFARAPRLQRGAAAMLASVALWAEVEGDRLGTRLTRAELITQALPVAVVRDGVIVHLPQEVPTALAERIADDHAYRWQALLRLVPQPDGVEPVHSFVFASRADKARWLGLSDTQIARPWRREIYLDGYTSPHPLVAHELSHVALAAAARAPLYVAARFGLWPNMPMVEGMAVALSPDTTALGLIPTACHMRALRLGTPLAALLNVNPLVATRAFWGESPERAYTVSGAFFSHLRANFGMAPLLDAYRDGDVARAFGTTTDALEEAFWRRHMPARTHENTRERVQADMRRGSLFVRRCPHEVAALRRRLDAAHGPQRVRLAQRLKEVTHDSVESMVVLAKAWRALPDGQAAAQAIEAQWWAQTPRDALERAWRIEHQSTLAAREEQWERARSLLQEGSRLPVSPSYVRLFATRLALLDLPPALRLRAWAALAGELSAAQAERVWQELSERPNPTQHAIGHYLLGRTAASRGDAEGACQHLELASCLPHGSLARERLQMWVVSAWLARRPTTCARALDAFVPFARAPAEQVWLADWRARLAFDAR